MRVQGAADTRACRRHGMSHVTAPRGRGNVSSSGIDEALHPARRPNLTWVWGFVVSGLGQLTGPQVHIAIGSAWSSRSCRAAQVGRPSLSSGSW
jgi:hypothetical protein